MEYRELEGGQLRVSRLGLGTATWGLSTDAQDAARQLKAFVAAGGTLIDTANIYGSGRSEMIIGDLLGSVIARREVVLATKAGLVPGKPPFRTDTSTDALLEQLDASLRRLRTDHVDLWQLHVWDARTPLEEAMAALDIAVSSGRALKIGVCNYSGWQTAMAAQFQKCHGTAPLATAEVEYSLIQRGIEREVVPAARQFGIGILPWAPLGRGVLTGKYRHGIPDGRRNSRFFNSYVLAHATSQRSADVVEAAAACAEQLGLTPLAVALSWVRDRPGVLAPIVGARTSEQLVESLKSESVVLPESIREILDKASQPQFGYTEHGLLEID